MERRGFLGRLFAAPVVAKALEKGVTFEAPPVAPAATTCGTHAMSGWVMPMTSTVYYMTGISTYAGRYDGPWRKL